jgi:hypothetical protein
MSLQKTILAVENISGNITEHIGEGFKAVFNQYKGQNVDLILSISEDKGMGWEWLNSTPICTCLDYRNDYEVFNDAYLFAYDRCINTCKK